MATDERLDRLAGTVQAPGSSVAARTSRIEKLIQMAEEHEQEMKDLVKWQAYLRTSTK